MLVTVLVLSGCKKEPLLNCKNVDLNTPYDSLNIDIKKLRCTNNNFPSYYAKEDIIPPTKTSPWLDQVCPDDMSSLSDEAIFRCANATLWDAIGDGRKNSTACFRYNFKSNKAISI